MASKCLLAEAGKRYYLATLPGRAINSLSARADIKHLTLPADDKEMIVGGFDNGF